MAGFGAEVRRRRTAAATAHWAEADEQPVTLELAAEAAARRAFG